MAAFQHSSRVALNNDDFISPEFRYFRSLPGRMFKPRDFVSKEVRLLFTCGGASRSRCDAFMIFSLFQKVPNVG